MTNDEVTQDLAPARLAFLTDTVEFYGADPAGRRSKKYVRGCLYKRCSYRGENGTKCAIGRHIPDECYNPFLEAMSVQSLSVLYSLPKDIQSLGYKFLRDIQNLHDGDQYWSETGLTTTGQMKLATIKQEYYL